jgi:glycosyltransferase involved in cell wall biosynthesis
MLNFSVLMSLYKDEQPEHLALCLKSLYDQTLPASEIVIVYDGPISRDLSEIVNTWHSKLPLKIARLSSNIGLGKALNFGLTHCKFNIVLRMDTDDICAPIRFEKQISYFVAHPKTDILGTYIEEFNKEPGDLGRIRSVPKKYDITKFIKFRNPINHMTVAFRKEKIIEIGGYIHLESMEDYFLWLRCYNAKLKIDNISEPLVYARVGSGMLDRRRGIKYVQSEFRLHIAKMTYLKNESSIKLTGILLIRLLPRLFPSWFLNNIYALLRKLK